MMKVIATILGEEYEVEGSHYTGCKLAAAEAYIKAHNLDMKKSNLIALVSCRTPRLDKSIGLLEKINQANAESSGNKGVELTNAWEKEETEEQATGKGAG